MGVSVTIHRVTTELRSPNSPFRTKRTPYMRWNPTVHLTLTLDRLPRKNNHLQPRSQAEKKVLAECMVTVATGLPHDDESHEIKIHESNDSKPLQPLQVASHTPPTPQRSSQHSSIYIAKNLFSTKMLNISQTVSAAFNESYAAKIDDCRTFF